MANKSNQPPAKDQEEVKIAPELYQGKRWEDLGPDLKKKLRKKVNEQGETIIVPRKVPDRSLIMALPRNAEEDRPKGRQKAYAAARMNLPPRDQCQGDNPDLPNYDPTVPSADEVKLREALARVVTYYRTVKLKLPIGGMAQIIPLSHEFVALTEKARWNCEASALFRIAVTAQVHISEFMAFWLEEYIGQKVDLVMVSAEELEAKARIEHGPVQMNVVMPPPYAGQKIDRISLGPKAYRQSDDPDQPRYDPRVSSQGDIAWRKALGSIFRHHRLTRLVTSTYALGPRTQFDPNLLAGFERAKGNFTLNTFCRLMRGYDLPFDFVLVQWIETVAPVKVRLRADEEFESALIPSSPTTQPVVRRNLPRKRAAKHAVSLVEGFKPGSDLESSEDMEFGVFSGMVNTLRWLLDQRAAGKSVKLSSIQGLTEALHSFAIRLGSDRL